MVCRNSGEFIKKHSPNYFVFLFTDVTVNKPIIGDKKSSISTETVKSIVQRLKLERNRSSTRRNYHTVWKIFSKFYLRLDTKPTEWEDRITLFVGYLIDQNKKASTVNSYISAIKTVLREDNVRIAEDRFLLSSLTKACKFRNNTATVRFPVHKQLLDTILNKLDSMYLSDIRNQSYLNILYQAMLATAYYGLFRVGEIALSPHVIQARDVHLGENKEKLLFILRSSKTHSGALQSVKICTTKLKGERTGLNKYGFCPYQLLKEYLRARLKYKENTEPFFVYRDRTPVTPNAINKVLKDILKHCGINPKNFSMHGMRAGRAGDLLKSGVSVKTIKKLG